MANRFWTWRNAPRGRVDTPAPDSSPAQLLYLLANFFWRLIGLNLLFLLACLPIVTIPAALSAMNRYLALMVRDGFGFSYGDFWKEYRAQLLKSLPQGLLFGLSLSAGIYLLSMAPQLPDEGQGVFTGAVGALLLSCTWLIGSYAFVLQAMLALPNRYILKNAALLLPCDWKAAAVVLGAGILSALLVSALFPYSLFLLILCGFSLLHLVLCWAVCPVVQDRIIGPYNRQHSDT